MSVVMVLKVKGDPAAMEAYAKGHSDQIKAVSQAGRDAGALHHMFVGGEGEVLVIDEWPNEAAFQKFFQSQPDIAEIIKGAGAQGAPEVTFYRKLATGEDF
jgi:quinol monooxygenase YgiN